MCQSSLYWIVLNFSNDTYRRRREKGQAPSVRLGTTASSPVTGPSTDVPLVLSDHTVASSPPQPGADLSAEVARGRRWRTWRRMEVGRGWSWRTVDYWSRIWSRLSFEPRYFEGKRKGFLPKGDGKSIGS